MAQVDLLLRAHSGAAHDQIDLLLGGDTVAAPVVYDATINGKLNLHGTVNAALVSSASISGKLNLRATVNALYDNAVSRGVVATVKTVFDEALPKSVAVVAVWQPSLAKPVDKHVVWQVAKKNDVDVRPRWQKSQALVQPVAVPWKQAVAVSSHASAKWRNLFATPTATALAWDVAKQAGARSALVFDHAQPKPLQTTVAWDVAKPLQRALAMPFDVRAKANHTARVAPWDLAKPVHSYGGAWSYVVPQVPPPYVQPRDTNLVLCGLQPRYTDSVVALILGGDLCAQNGTGQTVTKIILPARYYMAVHNITAQLLPSNAFIHIPSITVANDKDSFCWAFNASGHISLFDQLSPVNGLPQQIRFTIDGIAFVFVVGSVRKVEEFGKMGVQFSGHSVTKLLSAPYARSSTWFNSSAQTAQQLAANVLQYTSITLDWGVTDWLVPAGAWSHHGTPLSAVQSIAEAIGGYVQSHRTDPVLQVRHPYPLLAGGLPGGPWNWYASGVTPDVALAGEVLTTIATERRDNADVNGVYVSGTNQGVLAFIKRTGTAGEKLADMVTDPLITANAAASQRGISILGAAGSKHYIDFELPILTGSGQPGILDVGQLALVNQITPAGQTTPWRGRVRGVSASASFGGKVRQAINVERHLEVAP